MPNTFKKLKNEIIETGLCTHCGTCVGLSNKQLTMKQTENGPIPVSVSNEINLDQLAYDACPGKGFNYPKLVDNIFGSQVDDWRIGFYKDIFVGYSLNDSIRRNGASGGIITSLLIYLLKNKLIDGTVTVRQGSPKPWLAKPIIATTEDEIIKCAQSVYSPVSVNTIIEDMMEELNPVQKKKVLVITDRRQAIKTACRLANANDIVLVAGKGHEKYQEINGEKFPFDDLEELKQSLNIIIQ